MTVARTVDIGHQAEDAALAYLENLGLQRVARNFRAPTGEIDLVMTHDDELVFVEVRYRRTNRFGGALASVDSRKQSRLRRTAERFLQDHPGYARKTCRFDVLALGGPPARFRIDWIQDAF